MATSYILQGGRVVDTFLKFYKEYQGVTLTRDELFSKILKYDKQKFLNTLGSSWSQGLEEDVEKMQDAMDYLAKNSVGGLPDTASFFSALSDQLSTINLIKDIASASASDIGAGVQSFADNSLFVLKTLNAVFPYLIFGGIAYFLYINKSVLNLKALKK